MMKRSLFVYKIVVAFFNDEIIRTIFDKFKSIPCIFSNDATAISNSSIFFCNAAKTKRGILTIGADNDRFYRSIISIGLAYNGSG